MNTSWVLLDGPCAGTFALPLPGYPPTLYAVRSERGVVAVLDQPDDVPEPGETPFTYVYTGFGFLDFRDRRQGRDGQYGFYAPVPEGEHPCVDCGCVVYSPPRFPHDTCPNWGSGFHRLGIDGLAALRETAALVQRGARR